MIPPVPEPGGNWQKNKRYFDPTVDSWLRRQFGGLAQKSTSGLSPEVDQWLRTLRTEADTALPSDSPIEASKPESHRRVFILKIDFGRIIVDIARQRLLKNATWGTPEIWSWEQLRREPKSASAELNADRQIAVELAWAQETPGVSFRHLTGESGATLLAKLTATGRCYWLGSENQRVNLSLGETRPAELGWDTGPDGQQRTTLLMNRRATTILDLDPLWYVDEVHQTCGPVELAVPLKVARIWLTAPEIKSDEGLRLAAALETKPLPLPLPRPRRLTIRRVSDCRPVPCLHLMTVTPRKAFGIPTRVGLSELSLARFEFDYDGIRVPYGQPGTSVESIDGDTLREIQRRPNLESRMARSLEGIGLWPSSVLPFAEDFGLKAQDWVSEDSSVWLKFVGKVVPALKAENWNITEAEGFRWRVVEAEEWTTDAHSPADGDMTNQWFEVELGVVVDGGKINLLPLLLQLLEHDPHALSRDRLTSKDPDAAFPLRLPDGRHLLFPLSRARQILGVLLELYDSPPKEKDGPIRLDRLRAAELAGHDDWRWLGPTELGQMAQKLRNFQGIRSVPVPTGLQAQLRPYQKEGVDWLQFLREYDLAGILADDMGLGKTVQTLAHLLCEQQSGRADRPTLIVAPTTLMTNWSQEAARFAPSLRVLILHGLDRRNHFDRIPEQDVVLTTYSLLARDLPELLQHSFHYVILDEAQYIKNPKTTYAAAVCELKARHRLCLTGTPMENHLGELWSLFRFLLPGFLGDEVHFNRLFRHPIERQQDGERQKTLNRRVAPFMLRRKKSDVVLELPPKTEIVQTVEFGAAQRDLYESVRLAMHTKVQAEVAKKGLSRSHIVVLDALLKLRQICCHPQLLALPAAKKVGESAKLDLLMELLGPMVAEGRRILLFSQFTSMLDLIQTELKRAKIAFVTLTGETSDRATPVKEFQSGRIPVFLISLKAGGTGLNLTTADTVIHYDPWWNPAVENQATDRAHRIGQSKTVFVYKLIASGTVEEKIAAMQERKRALVEGLLGAESKSKLELGSDDIDFLFGPLA